MKKHTVLFVDQDSKNIHNIKHELRKEHFHILTAGTSAEAEAQLKKHEVHVIIAGEGLPEEGGLMFLHSLREKYPDTIRGIICLPDGNRPPLDEAIEKGDIYRLIASPPEGEPLKTAVRDCVEHYAVRTANRTSMEPILSAVFRNNPSREEDLIVTPAILNTLPQPAVVVDMELEILMFNKIYELGIAADLKGMKLPGDLHAQLEKNREVLGHEVRLFTQHKSSDFEVRVRPLRTSDSKSALLFFDDMSGVKK